MSQIIRHGVDQKKKPQRRQLPAATASMTDAAQGKYDERAKEDQT
jgi:hypothetical protein